MANDPSSVTKIWVGVNKNAVRSSHSFYSPDEIDDDTEPDDEEVLITKAEKERASRHQYVDDTVTLLDMVLSFGGFAKLIACIMFLSSAIVFNNATYEDHTTPNRKLSKAHMFYLILPACDISCAIGGVLVYICLLLLMAKGHIRNMIVLDITHTLVVFLMSLLASMVTMPEVGEVHINAAIMMMTGTLVQVVSGFSTLIKYCPHPRRYRESGSQI